MRQRKTKTGRCVRTLKLGDKMRYKNSDGVFAMIVMLTAIVVLSASVTHASATFESQLIADFEFKLLSDGPLGGAGFPEDVFIPFQARGLFTFELDDALNDSAATTAAFTDVTGRLVGLSPAPFLPFEIGPIEFVGGSLTNIVRDGGGNVISADVEALSMEWDMVASPGGGDEITLYTRGGLPFDSEVDSIPFSEGTILAGPDEFDGFLETGNGVNDPLAIIGRNRTLTVVPEPASLAILGTAFGLIVFFGRRRSRDGWIAIK